MFTVWPPYPIVKLFGGKLMFLGHGFLNQIQTFREFQLADEEDYNQEINY